MSQQFLNGRSVATQLLKIVFVLYCLVAITVTLVHIVEEYRHTRDTIANELRSYEKIFGPVLAKALWNLDREQVNDIVIGLSEVPVVVGVKIERLKGDGFVYLSGQGAMVGDLSLIHI